LINYNLVYDEKLKDKILQDNNLINVVEGIVDVVSSNDESNELKKDIVYLLNPWIGYLIEGKKKSETSVKLFLIYL
jgi:hypothetical protein